MKLFLAFFRLIRWQNLVFIALTQCLFYYCIISPALPDSYLQLIRKTNDCLFILIVLASVLIAAAGYIINDYFDINIDQINKPETRVVEKIIKRRWAIIFHLFFTISGLAVSIYISFHSNVLIALGNTACAILLWFYSTTFKKKLLSGNIIIAALTAWVILVMYFAFYPSDKNDLYNDIASAFQYIFKLAFLYAGFAFIISIIREVVKDIEDMEGDAKYGGKTMPISWGIPVAKMFVAVWITVLIAILIIVQLYVLQLKWWWSIAYCFVLVTLPLVWVLLKLYQAQTPKDYHRLSSIIKWVILTGILSMLFFKFYS